MIVNLSEILLDRDKLLSLQDRKMVPFCTLVGKPSPEFKEIFEKEENFYESLVYKHGLYELEFMIEDFYSTEDMVRPINVCYFREKDNTGCSDFASISLFMCFDYTTETIQGILDSMFEEIYYYSPEILNDVQALELMRYEDVKVMTLLDHKNIG